MNAETNTYNSGGQTQILYVYFLITFMADLIISSVCILKMYSGLCEPFPLFFKDDDLHFKNVFSKLLR